MSHGKYNSEDSRNEEASQCCGNSGTRGGSVACCLCSTGSIELVKLSLTAGPDQPVRAIAFGPVSFDCVTINFDVFLELHVDDNPGSVVPDAVKLQFEPVVPVSLYDFAVHI